jgi:hypothetical protein
VSYAQAIAHQLNNVLTVIRLQGELG